MSGQVSERNRSRDRAWWRNAVIYQIYPRSFFDSTGNGTGDLPGITQKMDYIHSLGVDAIWISPFFRSPMKDFGYDVSDYRDVDPLFGSLDDFDVLLGEAHERGLKVIIDQVMSHTSDHHPWFLESRNDRHNDKADWYVWADARRDGGPPNNWLAVFGGSAWEWEPRRRQYYLHNFLPSQPDSIAATPRCDAPDWTTSSSGSSAESTGFAWTPSTSACTTPNYATTRRNPPSRTSSSALGKPDAVCDAGARLRSHPPRQSALHGGHPPPAGSVRGGGPGRGRLGTLAQCDRRVHPGRSPAAHGL